MQNYCTTANVDSNEIVQPVIYWLLSHLVGRTPQLRRHAHILVRYLQSLLLSLTRTSTGKPSLCWFLSALVSWRAWFLSKQTISIQICGILSQPFSMFGDVPQSSIFSSTLFTSLLMVPSSIIPFRTALSDVRTLALIAVVVLCVV